MLLWHHYTLDSELSVSFPRITCFGVITGTQYHVDEPPTMSILIIPHIFTEYVVFEKMNQIICYIGKEIKV